MSLRGTSTLAALLNDQGLDHEFLGRTLAANLHTLVQILAQLKETARSLDLGQRHSAQIGENILTDLANENVARSVSAVHDESRFEPNPSIFRTREVRDHRGESFPENEHGNELDDAAADSAIAFWDQLLEVRDLCLSRRRSQRERAENSIPAWTSQDNTGSPVWQGGCHAGPKDVWRRERSSA
jgi:hypothetical protein